MEESDPLEDDSIRSEKAIIFSPKKPNLKSDIRFDKWGNHRAYQTIVKGEGGRPVWIFLEKLWNIDRNKVRQIKEERDKEREKEE